MSWNNRWNLEKPLHFQRNFQLCFQSDCFPREGSWVDVNCERKLFKGHPQSTWSLFRGYPNNIWHCDNIKQWKNDDSIYSETCGNECSEQFQLHLIWRGFLSFTILSVIYPLLNKNAENCLHHDENWRKELLPPSPTGCYWWAGGHWGWEGEGGWGKVGGLETSIGGQHAQPPCSHHGLLVGGCQLWCSYL